MTDDTLLMRMTEEQFTKVVDANLTGAYRVAKRATRGMLKARWGRMVFISSVSALTGAPGQVNYAASKAGLIGVARSITRELGGRNITANVVSPGFIPTDMTESLSESYREQLLGQIPAGRFGEADEVAAAVTFLASDGAAYINGAVVPVDGGMGMGN
jgi:3-oxoacyl-[acyl-carrier protein] reductase